MDCVAAKAGQEGLKPSLYEERLPPVQLAPSANPVQSNQSNDATRLKKVLAELADVSRNPAQEHLKKMEGLVSRRSSR